MYYTIQNILLYIHIYYIKLKIQKIINFNKFFRYNNVFTKILIIIYIIKKFQ